MASSLAMVAVALRLPAISESLWVDELHTAWVVSDAIQDVPQRAAMGNQASLYFYLVWLGTQLTGLHEWSLRLPSLIGSVCAVGGIVGIAHRWTRSSWIALAAGMLATVDVDWIFFATEARVYGLVQLAAIAQVAFAWNALEKDRRRDWIGLTLVTIVSFYLHYSTLLFSGTLAIALLGLANHRATRIRLLGAIACVAVAVLISLPHLMNIFERRENWASFISATSWNEWRRWRTAFACLAPVSVLAIAMGRWQNLGWASAEIRRLVLLLAVVIVPIAIGWVTTATDIAALFFGRYLISSESLIPLLFAATAVLIPPPWWRRGAILLGLGIALAWRTPAYLGPMRGEDWRTVVHAASAELKANEATTDVLISAGLIESDILRLDLDDLDLWETYARLPVESIYALPSHEGQSFGLTYTDPGQATPSYLANSNADSRVFLIIRGSESYTDQVVQNFVESVPERTYEIHKPEVQAARVQWRILSPRKTDD